MKTTFLFLTLTLAMSAAPTTSGNVTILTGPQNLTSGSLTSDTNTFLIQERLNYALPSAVTLDTLTNGITYSTFWPVTSSTLPAGTLVDVWLFHVQRSSSLGNLTSTIDFGSPILGYAGRSVCGLGGTCPAATDVHGGPGNTYAASLLRGIELLISNDTITQNSNTSVTILARTSPLTLDEVRIFVLSTPEPGTMAGTGAALAALALLRRRSARV
jgi:hypothetical protein